MRESEAAQRGGLPGALRRSRRLGPRPTPLASGAAMARIATACFFTGGLVGFLTALVSPAWDDRDAALLISSVSLLGSLATAIVGRRLSVRVYYGLVYAGIALLAVQMWTQPGNAEAVAAALILPLISMFVWAFFDRRSALVTEGAILATILVAGVWSALPLPIAATLICTNTLTAVVTGWLVQAAAEAETDLLTGLPNRRGLTRALRAALAVDAGDAPLTLALLDVEPLVDAGVQRGQRADGLLRGVGRAWGSDAAGVPVVARYSDTSFAVLVPGDVAATAGVLAELRRLLGATQPAEGIPAGTAAVRPGDTPAGLTGRAESALLDARRAGGSHTVHYQDHSQVAARLAAALANGEFFVAYQPIADAVDGHTTGAEALVRWARPGVGTVPPDEFIPDAERTGFISILDRWVLRTACQAAAAWPREVASKITVNVSGRELDQPGYYQDVVAALELSGLPADRLVLEVTESTLDADSELALEVLRRLRDLGVRIAIDDFGTGYSSLSRLHRLPADILKIDRSFVAELRPDQEAPVIAAITALAHALGLRTVAEGVEEAHQATVLARYGCDELQGWLHGRPGGADVIGAALQLAAQRASTEAMAGRR